MKKIAVYGKGGIGKSTVVSNMSAALSAMGYTVMQIGCDPKSDSTRNLMGGQRIPTVLETMRDRDHVALEDIVLKSECGVYCVESGGPIPGVGCAGRGIIAALEKLADVLWPLDGADASLGDEADGDGLLGAGRGGYLVVHGVAFAARRRR